MKLYEKFGDTGFHSSIMTTFSLDFEAYENIALNRLRGAGCRNNILIADSRMLTHALSGESAMPSSAGQLYSVTGAKCAGLFHSKIILQFGRRKGRLIIGSANATASGLAGNLEIVGQIECTNEPSPEQQIVLSAWDHVTNIIDHEQKAIKQQIAWMQQRTSWLKERRSSGELVTLSDGTDAAFLGSHDELSLLRRCLSMIGAENVKRLIIISPYWDEELKALTLLYGSLKPQACLVLIDVDKALFPGSSATKFENFQIIDIGPFANNRFVHAKMILAECDHIDHVVFGSANCTNAALGGEYFRGTNDEACLYRRFPKGTLLKSINLTNLVDTTASISTSDLPKQDIEEKIDLEGLGKRNPGQFETFFDVLTWKHPQSINPDDVEIELLTITGRSLEAQLDLVDKPTPSEARYKLKGFQQRPGLASVMLPDGSLTARAVITHFDLLKSEVREARTKKLDDVIDSLSGETEESFWLYEQMEALISASEIDHPAQAKPSKPGSTGPRAQSDETAISHKTLDYSKFVAGRKLRVQSSTHSQNSLLGSEASIVRDCLNSILILDSHTPEVEIESNEHEEHQVFDRGDEVEDGAGALEGGEDFFEEPSRRKPSGPNKSEKEVLYRKIQRKQTTQHHLDKAVKQFKDNIAAKIENNGLNNIDVLRLRALIMILAAAGYDSQQNDSLPDGSPSDELTSLQVLRTKNYGSDWAITVGKALIPFFGSKKPITGSLYIEDIYEQIPDDLIECWATCAWVCCAALSLDSLTKKWRSGYEKILRRIYVWSGLITTDLTDHVFASVVNKMSERFSKRLGIKAEDILIVHHEYIQRLHNPENV